MIKLDLRPIYRNLLLHPRDKDSMLVFADALEESGYDDVAFAYRWAVKHDKWPFVRHDPYTIGVDIRRFRKNPRSVYDWDFEGRERYKKVMYLN